MKHKTTYGFIRIILLSLICSLSFGQTNYKSEDDLKKHAEQLFSANDFVTALPLFSELLSLYPNDPDYNFKYGTCLLFADPDKTRALKYLEYAAGRPNTDPLVYFYLGKAYHFNYRFSEAIDNYRKFKERGKSKMIEQLETDRQIEMCENGRRLLRTLTDLIVTDKKNLKDDDFYKAYDLSDYGGKLIRKPEEFKTSLDKKMGDRSVMYLDENASVIYFSSYGNNMKNGRDIYRVKRLPNGEWGKPENMGPPINTVYDEDFPFLHPSGDVFYFASKGHNSMGGYDIFKSYYDDISGNWGQPVNQDFAINTPADDYLFVTNADESFACFSSNRACAPSEVTVFNIKVKRVPLNLKIIKGDFIASNTKTAKITVEDNATGQIAGIFNTDPENGSYLINLPGSGSYKFIVETDKSPVAYVGKVEIPELKDFQPLYQEMKLVNDNGQEKLIINNLFDILPENDNVEELAAEVIKEKAELNVNEEQYQRTTILDEDLVASKERETSEALTENFQPDENNTYTFTQEEMISSAYRNAEILQREADSLRMQSNLSYALASDKKKEAQLSSDKADQLLAASMDLSDETERQEMIREANQLKKQSLKNAREASMIYDLAGKLDTQASERQEEASEAQKYAEEFESAVNETSSTASLDKLNQLRDYIENSEKEQIGIDAEKSEIHEKAIAQRALAAKQTTYADRLREERMEIEKQLKETIAKSESTRKKRTKEELQKEVKRLENELEEIKADEQKAYALADASDSMASDLEIQFDVMDAIASQMEVNAETASISPEEKKEIGNDIDQLQESIYENYHAFSIEDDQTLLAYDHRAKTSGNAAAVEMTEENKTSPQFSANAVADAYKAELSEAEQIEDQRLRAEKKARIYQQMKEDIDNRIAELYQEKESTKSKKEKQHIDDQIQQLTILRNSTAENYEINNSLSIAEKDNTEGLPNDQQDTEAFQQTDVTECRKRFESKLSQANAIEDPTEKASRLAEIREETTAEIDASIDLLNQALLAETGSYDRNQAETQIADLQNLRDQINAETSEYNAVPEYRPTAAGNSPEDTANTAKFALSEYSSDVETSPDNAHGARITDHMDAPLPDYIDISDLTSWMEMSKTNEQQAARLEREAKMLRNKAQNVKKKEKEQLLDEAEKMETEASEKRMQAERDQAYAQAIGSAASNAILNLGDRMESEKQQSAANRLQAEADSLLVIAQLLEDSANGIKKGKERKPILERAQKEKQAAAIKQEEADLAFELADEMRSVENKVIQKVQQDALAQIAPPAKIKYLDEVGRQWAMHSDELKNYTTKKFVADKISKRAENLKEQAREKQENSRLQLELASNLKTAAADEPDAERRQAQIEKSEQFTNDAHRELHICDSLIILSQQLSKQADELYTSAEKHLSAFNAQLDMQLTAMHIPENVPEAKQDTERSLADELTVNNRTGNHQTENSAQEIQDRGDDTESIAYRESGNASDTAVFHLSASHDISDMNPEPGRNEDTTEAPLSEKMDFSETDAVHNQTVRPVTETVAEQVSESNDVSDDLTVEMDATHAHAPDSPSADELFEEDVFEKTDPEQSFYDEAHPIPVAVDHPSGLIYKVQVGAFRNPIPQNLFKGFAPITAEKRNDGITRYQAGRFRTFKTADLAKNEIRSLGYSDAFVVAYMNGKRIPVTSAQQSVSTVPDISHASEEKILAPDLSEYGNALPEQRDAAQPAVKETTADISTTSTTSSVSATPAQSLPFAELINDVDGLYFTVQIGVFSKPVSKEELHNISPLNMERTSNGLYRYTSGKYLSPKEAAAARDRIIRQGVADAFITAYYNGKRIPISQAIALMRQSDRNETKATAQQTENHQEVHSTTTTPEDMISGDNKAMDAHISVQVGPYDGDVPVEEAGVILELSHYGVERIEDANGLTVYAFGKFDNYEDAEQLKDTIVQMGMHTAHEIGVVSGEIVDIEDVLEMLEN